MYWLYGFMLAFWSILLFPLFLYKAWRRQAGLPGIRERLGRLPHRLRSGGRSTIWLHACSVGEVLSIQPLVKALHERFPDTRFVFSTTTPTGQAIAAERFARYGEGNIFYFPIDLAFAVERVLEWVQPKAVIIIDTEIWPNLLRRAYIRNIPVILVNGRISRASFRYYRWLRPFLRHVLSQYSFLLMQSQEDASRVRKMGASEDTITVTGNIKFDVDMIEETTQASASSDLEAVLRPGNNEVPIVIAGSTHPGEEHVLLTALRNLRSNPGLESTRLVLAPRHPERFDAVAQLVKRSGFLIRRRTCTSDTTIDPEVILLDTLGELAAAYRLATVVFVGGTLVRHGGHSVMEPARHSKAIVVGPSMENFQSALKEFLAHGGIRQITANWKDREQQARQLEEVLRHLLLNPAERNAMGLAARSVLDRNRGAVLKTVQKLEAILEQSAVY